MKLFLPLSVAACASLSGLSNAAVLVNSGLNGGTQANLDAIGKSLAFTTGSTAYSLDSVLVRLSRDASGTIDPNLVAGIYASTTSGTDIKASGSALVSFAIPTIAAGTAATNFTLTPTSAFVLAPNTTYFFVLYNTVNTNPTPAQSSMFWWYDTSAVTTAGGVTIPDVAAAAGTQVGWFPNTGTLSNPSSWNGSSGVYNDFQLNGTIIPEPSVALLGGAFAGLGLLRRRRA